MSNINLIDSFQVIITDGTDAGVGIGNNVAFYYGKMGWTTGDASGGSGGFGGTPATVGVNAGDGTHYIQVGRFGLNSSAYTNNTSTSGVHYLNYTCYAFNVSGAGNVRTLVNVCPPSELFSTPVLPARYTVPGLAGEIAIASLSAP